MRRSSFYNLCLALLLVASGSQAFGNVFRKGFFISNPKTITNEAKIIFGEKVIERSLNNEHIFVASDLDEYIRRAHPGEIFNGASYLKSTDDLDEGLLYQSWREEAAIFLNGTKIPQKIYLTEKEDLYQHFHYQGSPIALAEQIAKVVVYKTIVHNWDVIKTTVFNGDYGINCSSSDIALRKCLAFNDTVPAKVLESLAFSYSDTIQDKENYVFKFQGDDGYISVSKNLKKAQVVIGISYYSDRNRVIPEAKNYRTDVEAGIAPIPQPSSSATAAPNSDATSGQ